MIFKAWKDGRLEACALSEFTQSLRCYSGWADQEFGTRSDPAAHLGERLNAAADALDSAISQRVLDEEVYRGLQEVMMLIGAKNDNLSEAVKASNINAAWHILDRITSAVTSTPSVPAQRPLDLDADLKEHRFYREAMIEECAQAVAGVWAGNDFALRDQVIEAIRALSTVTSKNHCTAQEGIEPGEVASRPATYCAHCDREHPLHEDARGFHHVIRGERVPCCSVSSTNGKQS